MASGLSDKTISDILEHITGETDWSPTPFAAGLFLGWSTTVITDTGTGGSAVTGWTEATDGGYARVTMEVADWTAIGAGTVTTIDNDVEQAWAVATANWSSGSNITTLGAWTHVSQTTGNDIAFYGDVGTAKAVLNGDTAKILVNNLDLTLTNS